MSRDHRKLRVFHQAHKLTLAIYRHTRGFPREEWFGLRTQMRRASVSVPSNLVEGNARSGERDYLRFLNIALGSACEVKYLTSLTLELGYASGPEWAGIIKECDGVVRQLQRLVQQMEQSVARKLREPNHRTENSEDRPETEDRRPRTEDRRRQTEDRRLRAGDRGPETGD
jgi:four helix bundle protein